MRRALLTVTAALLGLAATAPAGSADGVIAVVVPFRYSPEPIEIAQGGAVTFANLDPVSGEGHSLTHAAAEGAELFKTPIIPPGSSAPVAGVADLAVGEYRFTCRVHAFMRGVLTVRGGAG